MSLGLVISPAKRMDVVDAPDAEPTSPLFLDRTVELMRVVQALDPAAQQALWRTGDELTRLSRERFSAMDECALRDASALTPAVLSFHGIQYQHLAACVMDSSQLAWLDAHLRILSGFYGLLRPGDGVMPYRLEMGARLAVGGHRDLYGFWGRALADELARGADVIVNLASVEYARAVTPFLPDTPARLVTCLFATLVDGRLLQRATEAKAARGTFVRWCAEEGVEDVGDLGSFCERGYRLDEGRSDAAALVFVRQNARMPADAASNRQEASWWLYVLRCADGSLYTGIATDVERRLSQHNAGTGAKYTRSRRPCEVVYRERCADKSAALRRELQVKGLSRAQKLELVGSLGSGRETCGGRRDG